MSLRLPSALLGTVSTNSGNYFAAACARERLQCALGFHSSASTSATLKGKGRPPARPSRGRGRGRGSPKGLSRSQFNSTSRTRLVRDLKPKGSDAKYEVARKPFRTTDAKKQDGASVSKNTEHEPPAHAKAPEPHVVAAEKKASVEALLDEEFDRSLPQVAEKLPDAFTSPPLLPTFAQSVSDVLGPDAKPTPIQALALKRLFSLSRHPEHWKAFLLASETGSGKSIAYLLPLLQYLKETETSAADPPSRLAVNPRALVLAPTHELTRQLSAFAKALVHRAKLRVLCVSRANVPSTAGGRMSAGGGSARQMKHVVDALGQGAAGHLEVRTDAMAGARPVDVLASTPVKALEMVRGWGWDKVGKEDSRFEREFRPGKPEMGLKRVECVVVDEADVLFDPDFRETTLSLLADISEARGHPVPAHAQNIDYPFHLILTSATIPASLSSYLTKHHPALTRLASPQLHRLPVTLHTEHVGWTGGNRLADVERRLRRVWAEDALRGPDAATGRVARSRVLVFCNRSTAADALGAHLSARGIANVALTSTGAARLRGSNRHLAGFVKGSDAEGDEKDAPRVLITTSLLSRGLDFAADVQHVFIVDSPRNMVDFLHRAGRSGRAGQQGKVVVFGKLKGRGSGLDMEVKNKVRALVQR
ncbi:P-loop containing nucleoside triphosphate hydrolase protein [Phellopilus nigrolimitatus]|nr:P-loop containing nucleoside triphosphate hydrolase protein [Phellopilus nigrolimitatus]